MDSLIFQAMAVELNRALANSRLDRVIQITAGTLVLRFWTGREKIPLLVKSDGQGCFCQTRQIHAAPARPPRFCQLLRARLRRLVEVRAEPLDRIVHFYFSGPDGDKYDLILEGFGAQGNLVLVDSERQIVDLMWRREGARLLLPGEPYVLPEQKQRLSLFDAKVDSAAKVGSTARAGLVSLLSSAEDPQQMSRLDIAPMSPALAQAICSARKAGLSPDAILDKLQAAFNAGPFEPVRVTWEGQTGLLPLSLGLNGFETIERFEDLSEMLEAYMADEGHETQ